MSLFEFERCISQGSGPSEGLVQAERTRQILSPGTQFSAMNW